MTKLLKRVVRSARCRTVIVSLCALASCSRSSPNTEAPLPIHADAASMDRRVAVQPRPDAARDSASKPAVPSDCVVDEGETVRGSRTETDPNGKSRAVRKQSHCSLSANCIREQGRETAGDATVAIDCRGGRCVCAFELFAPHRKRIKFDVTAQDPCEDDDGLKRLLFEHCLSEGRQRTTSSRDQHAGQH
jgi:hypothetical protein